MKRRIINFLMALVNAWPATIYVFLRQNMGRNRPGVSLWLGILWIGAWMAYKPESTGLLWLIVSLMVFSRVRRIAVKSNVDPNSSGDPIAARMLGFKQAAVAKRGGESLIALVIGVVILYLGHEEGLYFLYGALAMGLNQSLIEIVERRSSLDKPMLLIEYKRS